MKKIFLIILLLQGLFSFAQPNNQFVVMNVNGQMGIGGCSTDDLTEGATNYYWTEARFNSSFSAKNTDNLTEGSTNQYWTASKFNTAFSGKTTDWLSEGGINLYYTTARARSAFSAGTGISIASGIITATGGLGTVTSVGLSSTDFVVSSSPVTTSGTIVANLATSGVTPGTYKSVTVNNKGITTGGTNISYNNAPARTIVTTAAAANGFLISLTKDALVTYSVSITTSVSLGGNSSGYVLLEICPTNSSTAGDWIEVSRCTSGQSGTLVIGLTLNQVGGAALSATVPAGYYTRLRSVNSAGTPTYSNAGQQEAIF